jgi:hypothetical protein
MSKILSLIQNKLLSLPVDCVKIAYGGNAHLFDELVNMNIEKTPISDMPKEKDFLLKATHSVSEDWAVKEVVNGQNLIIRGFVFPDGAVSFLIADDYDVAVGLGAVDDGMLRFSAFKGVDSPVFERTVSVETACEWTERFIDALVDGSLYEKYGSIEEFFAS